MASLIKRNGIYQVQWYTAGKKINRRSLETKSLQIAKEKLRQFESAQARGEHNPLPTKTPLEKIINEYMETVKTAKSAQTDVYRARKSARPVVASGRDPAANCQVQDVLCVVS